MAGDTGATDAEKLLDRFRKQIEYAAKAIAGKAADPDEAIKDARQQAALLTLEYLKAGKIDELQAKVDANPGFAIEQLFMQELKCDLLTWVAREKKDRRRAARWVASQPPPADGIDIAEFRRSFPLWCKRVFDRMSIPEIAEELGVSGRTVDRRLAVETAQAAEFFGDNKRGRVRENEGVLHPRVVFFPNSAENIVGTTSEAA